MPDTLVHSAQLPATPVGTLKIWATDRGIRRISFRKGPDVAGPGEELSTAPAPPHLAATVEALAGYFRGSVRSFSHIPLDLGALTDFQLDVYDELLRTPFGHVTTYGAISEALGLGAGGARAVGQAVGANPVAIVVPCHRVVGSDSALHGYAGGLDRKAALLRHEGIVVDGSRPTSRVHPEELRLNL